MTVEGEVEAGQGWLVEGGEIPLGKGLKKQRIRPTHDICAREEQT